MKAFKLLFFLLTILLVNDKNCAASHAMGADLTYKCLGPGTTTGSYQYEITYSFYRDCNGIQAPAAPLLIITNSCGFTVPSVSLISTPGSPIQISPVCPSGMTSCDGGTLIGIEEWIYKATVTIPGPCHDWTFSHSESARNGSITTLNTSGNLFVYTVLNNTVESCHDSPVFMNRPVPILCVNQQFCYNNSAVSTDGDSLTYQIIAPRYGPLPADTVVYSPGYSRSQPLLSNPPMLFNNSTGEFCITPIQTDVSVLAILVNVYRNGNLIGQIERDIQIIVDACVNNLPTLQGFNGTPFRNETVCLNKQNCFFIPSSDAGFADTTYITWDQAIPNASFTTLGGKRDTAIFCWTPTLADTLMNPYCFTATVKDNNCPYTGTQVFTYCLTIDNDSVCIPLKVFSLPIENIKLNFYPNPVKDVLTIELDEFIIPANGYQIQVLDLLGELKYISPVPKNKFELNLETIPAGLYVMRLINGQQGVYVCKKFVVMD